MFWFRLAAHFGCTVQELQGRLTSYEFAEWMAYYMIEPFGESRSDMRSALQTAYAVAPYLPKGRQAKVSDYMLGGKREQTDEDMQRACMAHAAQYGRIA